jgi:asparagine synthase (glutamine-hydrolysing)
MCGIAGILGAREPDAIRTITRTLQHRGPDDEGYYEDPRIALGQRRLSIVDLSGGHQPIGNETGEIWLVCNGEIYNSPELRAELIARGHVFKTHTDVEVILHLYEELGEGCCARLRGMFAFAVWDGPRRRLLLGRDPLGQKPLYFCRQPDGFLFASEVKALLASKRIPPKIDLDGMGHYISLRYLPDHYTMFEGIHKLPAASWLSLRGDGEPEIQRYWTLSFTPKTGGDEAELTDRLEAVLLETVKLHLMSDVTVGAFLSGGIDSSLITAMMAKLTGVPFPTFSIGVKEQGFNELPFARMVSEKYRLDGREKVVESDMIHLIPAMVHHMDEPSDPFGAGVYLVSREAAREVKVVLGGDGGDENFAGYDRFAGQRITDLYCLLPRWFRRQVVQRITRRIPESFGYKSAAQKIAWLNEMSLFSRGERYAQSMSFLRFTPEAKRELFTDAARARMHDTDSVAKILGWFDAGNADDLVDRMLYTDLMTRIPDHLLTIVDRMSMAHSLEARPPLLDHRLVEFAATLPADLKLKGRNLKYLLKKVAARYLPRELIEREKQGFGFPIAIWLRTELRPLLLNLFRQSRFVELGLFRDEYVQRILNEHLDGRRDHNFRLWILINLEIWYRMYFEGETVESMRDFMDRLNR